MRSNAASRLAAASSSARASSGPRSWARTSPGALQGAFDQDACRLGVLDHATAQGKGRLQTSSGGGRVSWGPASVAGAGIITP
jgi:hypothetical protein